MGADQQFCLRWNNFHTNITSAFESLRDDEDFVDITLACEGRQIKAHKMVLSACSPYFRSLLRGNPCQHPIVFLKDVSFAHLTSILNFMYHGEVNVSHNELATFLKTAEALRVRGLAEDEKKRDGETCTESSSPPPPRDPPEPCSPSRTEEPPGEGGGGRVSAGDAGGGGDDNTSSEGPPIKRQRRRSGNTSSHTEHDTNTSDHLMQQTDTSSTTIRESVKNEPEDYVNEDDDMLGHQQQQLANEDIKMDGYTATTSEDSVSEYMGGSDSVSISSRSQAAMQQLQDTFSTFIPGMTGQNPASFLPHSTPGGTDHGRPHPPFSLEGVQGLPPGISALPGPSMSQGGGASQDTSGQDLMGMTSSAILQVQEQHHHHHHHHQQAPLSRQQQQQQIAGTSLFLDNSPLTLSSLEFQQLTQSLAPVGGACGGPELMVYPSISSANTMCVGEGLGGFNSSSNRSKTSQVCPYCQKILSTNHGLRRHIVDKHTIHEHSYVCPLCGKNYRTPNSLQNHIYVYHNKKNKECVQTVVT